MQANRLTQTYPRKCLATLATALAGIGWSGVALAFNPQPDPPAFGLVAMVKGQVAQFNAVCSNLPSEVSPGPCRAELSFNDINGKPLKRMTIALRPGRSASLALPASSEGRIQLQPVILLDQGSGRVIPTVEVFDEDTGRTTLLIAPVNGLPAVQK